MVCIGLVGYIFIATKEQAFDAVFHPMSFVLRLQIDYIQTKYINAFISTQFLMWNDGVSTVDGGNGKCNIIFAINQYTFMCTTFSQEFIITFFLLRCLETDNE